MCYAKPGPRCSSHTLIDLKAANLHQIEVESRIAGDPVTWMTTTEAPTPEIQAKRQALAQESHAAKDRMAAAFSAYCSSPAGIRMLDARAEETGNPEDQGKADHHRLLRAKAREAYLFSQVEKTTRDRLAAQLGGFPNFVRSPSGDMYFVDDSGHLHNPDGPAVVHTNGDVEYKLHGKSHRTDGPAFFSSRNGGREEYWVDGQEHRDGDQPAIIAEDGTQEYYQHGKKHRLLGPAIEREDGSSEYWLEGVQYNEHAFTMKVASLQSA